MFRTRFNIKITRHIISIFIYLLLIWYAKMLMLACKQHFELLFNSVFYSLLDRNIRFEELDNALKKCKHGEAPGINDIFF